MKHLVSVVMPVYNQERFLEETIESVLAQTYSDFEFLILDDGSTDNSAQIIRKYAAQDKRIVAFFESNAGKCVATNNLVDKAKGRFCVFLDADDIMLPERIERQISFHLARPEVEASSCHCFYIDEKGKNLGHQRYPFLQTVADCKEVVKRGEIILCAFTGLCITKECYVSSGGLRPDIWPCEDVEFTNRLIEKGHILLIIQETLMNYRIHSSSITARDKWKVLDWNDYVNYCIKMRRVGKAQISFEEYMEQSKKRSWSQKLTLKRKRCSVIFHKEAGFAFYSKDYLRFCWLIGVSILCNPQHVISGFRNRLSFSKPQR